MRRITISLLLAVALGAPSGAQQKKTDLEHAGLIGKVKTVKVEETKVSNKDGKKTEGRKTQVETQSYNDKGALTKAVRFDAGRATDYFYSYDSTGNRLEFSRTTLGESRIKAEFKYDANGNRLEEVQTGEEGLLNRLVFTYDTKGRATEKRIYNKQGLFARRTYSYVDGVNPAEEAEYDSKGGLVGKQRYSYELDSTGNWVKRVTSTLGTSNGKPVSEPVRFTHRTIAYY